MAWISEFSHVKLVSIKQSVDSWVTEIMPPSLSFSTTSQIQTICSPCEGAVQVLINVECPLAWCCSLDIDGYPVSLLRIVQSYLTLKMPFATRYMQAAPQSQTEMRGLECGCLLPLDSHCSICFVHHLDRI